MKTIKSVLCMRHVLAVAAAIMVAGRPVGAAEPKTAAMFSEKDIQDRLRKGHPRLLATAEDFERLKTFAGTDAKLKEWHEKLRREGEKMLSEAPSKYEISESAILLPVSRQVLLRVQTLALLYRLSGDKRYADRVWEELKRASAFKDWNPENFLDTAEMTRAFAVGYDWLHDAWDEEQREKLRTAIVEKGLKPALGCYRGTAKYRAFHRLRNNWNQVCNAGIGLGALAIAELEPELCGEILRHAITTIRLGMGEYAPAGAWKEGPSYWDYATEYNVAFLAALESALGTDFGLSAMAGFADTGWFAIYMTGPLGLTVNYADSSEGRIHAPDLFWLARKFDRPEYAKWEIAAAEPKALDLVWYARPAEALPELALGKHFRGAEVATMRSAWDDHDALFVGFKAGDNAASHGHLDLGSFVLDALGKRWAVDLGGDDYTLPGYFGRERWTYYRLRAEGHNTVIIDPRAGPDQEPNALAKIERFESWSDRSFAIAELTPAYAGEVSNLRRGIVLSGRDHVLVQDEMKSAKPREVWWFMHTPADIEIGKEGKSAMLTQGKLKLWVRLLSPPAAALQAMEAVPLATSPHPARQAKNDGIRKLSIHLLNVTDLRLVVAFVPLGVGKEAIGNEMPIAPLDSW